ncbi:YybH family protein [Dyadobacter tibetensis]|uniref:YybH family protein n=1 Tax=Dyadobacter tibetensis TaxID=1211851 RepID=UPI0004729BF5|nr:nuclear transport factor 2 family protein [Dyadobacter tibetensis]
MRNTLLYLVLLSSISICSAQQEVDQRQIIGILDRQVIDWNAGKIDAFMQAYWPSDSLMFVGRSGITYGYQATYENYLRRYPDRETMGTLAFTYQEINFPAPDLAFIVGKFHLARPQKGDASGYFTLLWRKIKGQWLIVCDHTSS